MQTPEEHPQPEAIHKKSRQLRTDSDQLLLRLKLLLHESEQHRKTANTRLDELMEQLSADIMTQTTR